MYLILVYLHIEVYISSIVVYKNACFSIGNHHYHNLNRKIKYLITIYIEKSLKDIKLYITNYLCMSDGHCPWALKDNDI